MTQFSNSTASLSLKEFKNQLLSDYKLVTLSRECSLLGRKEVLSGKAKFGIFGDGKELPQLAWSKVFKKGDHRSGYYRDQTVMMALELLSAKQIFHALYATTDLNLEPMSAGRQMGGHFLTPFLDENGNWLNQNEQSKQLDVVIHGYLRTIPYNEFEARAIAAENYKNSGDRKREVNRIVDQWRDVEPKKADEFLATSEALK